MESNEKISKALSTSYKSDVEKVKKEVKDINFKPNRAVIFLHSPYSIHGSSKISNFAECNRYSFYYDFYSSEDNAYNGIFHVDKKYLHGSPHTFFLPSKFEYLKYKNIRYTMQHLRGFYGFIKHNLFNPKYNKWLMQKIKNAIRKLFYICNSFFRF